MIASFLIRLLKPGVERFPTLAYSYRRWRDNKLAHRRAATTPHGFKFIGQADMQDGRYEIEEVALVKQFLRECEVFLNVGANFGYYCCLARSFGIPAIAFEPIPLNCRALLQNLHINGFGASSEVYPIAVSDQIGVAEIYGGGSGASLVKGWGGTPDSNVTLVPTSTLDVVLGTRLEGKKCFILVDVEGAEAAILQGAHLLLKMRPRPVWMMEIAVSEHQPDGRPINPNLMTPFNTFWSNGYEAWTAECQPRLVNREELVRIAASNIDTLGTHNFLFGEPGAISTLLDRNPQDSQIR
ncbi:MAG: FkbM family methyltransferase [Methylocystis silviterrae]|uniref:FkbM family methyltransferase n=1 Tax=Methylocystis silviterrae TaxID=2743612 RepID=UPI003C7554CA